MQWELIVKLATQAGIQSFCHKQLSELHQVWVSSLLREP